MIRAILFDRDGTLIAYNPGNRNARGVQPMEGAREAVVRARAYGLKLGVVTNQPGLTRGEITRTELDSVHRHIDEILGPFDGWFVCPHAHYERCHCRKPQPGLLLDALAAFGVSAGECVMIGDIGSDVEAARAIGMRAILVPTAVTLPDEVVSAPLVARSLLEAVESVIGEAAAA